MHRNNASSPWATVVLAAFVASAASLAHAHTNPVDTTSNPNKLKFEDVNAPLSALNEPFVRDGVVQQPSRFQEIRVGMPADKVRQSLSAPEQERKVDNGTEWDYNFKFRTASGQYLVCQYKVVLDGAQVVKDTVWRRRQCQSLAGTKVAGAGQ